ncbi:hypothetical protein KIN20_007007, partial [Parelaphostrongylus tenuis]
MRISLVRDRVDCPPVYSHSLLTPCFQNGQMEYNAFVDIYNRTTNFINNHSEYKDYCLRFAYERGLSEEDPIRMTKKARTISNDCGASAQIIGSEED